MWDRPCELVAKFCTQHTSMLWVIIMKIYDEFV